MTDDFDLEVRKAIREEAYRAPVRLAAATLRARLDAGDARPRARRPWLALLAAAAGMSIVVTIAVLRPTLMRQGAEPSAVPAGSTGCDVSPAMRHGSWWVEIGGPGAYFNIEPGSLQATEPGARWLVITRFHPDPGSASSVSIWAERAGAGPGGRVEGSYNSPMDPGSIYRLDEPAPDLPGGWYLFEQEVPTTGCWLLTAAIDGRVVGSATIEVLVARQPATPDPVAPTPDIAGGLRPGSTRAGS
jgi:hypothetical protein